MSIPCRALQGRLSLSTDGDKCAMVSIFFWGGGINRKFNTKLWHTKVWILCTNELIIYSLQYQKSGFDVRRPTQGRIYDQEADSPSCLQGRPLHRSMDAACMLEKYGGTKSMHIFMKVGRRKIKGKERLSYLSVYLLYFIVFLQFCGRLRLIHN